MAQQSTRRLRAEAKDPTTSPERLYELAMDVPEAVLQNPAVELYATGGDEAWARVFGRAQSVLADRQLQTVRRKLSLAQKKELAARAALRALPVYEAAHPGDPEPRALLGVVAAAWRADWPPGIDGRMEALLQRAEELDARFGRWHPPAKALRAVLRVGSGDYSGALDAATFALAFAAGPDESAAWWLAEARETLTQLRDARALR